MRNDSNGAFPFSVGDFCLHALSKRFDPWHEPLYFPRAQFPLGSYKVTFSSLAFIEHPKVPHDGGDRWCRAVAWGAIRVLKGWL